MLSEREIRGVGLNGWRTTLSTAAAELVTCSDESKDKKVQSAQPVDRAANGCMRLVSFSHMGDCGMCEVRYSTRVKAVGCAGEWKQLMVSCAADIRLEV